MMKQILFNTLLALCRLETPKCVLLQTVKTQMKCHIMWHFIRVCTVCQDKTNLPRESSGSVVECLTRDRRAAGSSLTGVTGLCP